MSPTPKRVNHPLADLYRRPGFLLRRAHQIAVGMFLEECRAIKLTPPQHGVLIAVQWLPGLTQARLARLLGFDRATVGQVVDKLVKRGLLHREISNEHRRNTSLTISPAGAALLRSAAIHLKNTSRRLLAPLNHNEREVFLQHLLRLTNELNCVARTPIIPEN